MDARILLVEDDADLRDALAAALAADGHRVTAAADGEEAIGALAEHDHTMAVLDVALGPGPDGVEVCRRLRRVDRTMWVMMLTARDAEADVVMALEAGADDYVVKPVGIAELRSRVRAALRRLERGGEPAADENGRLLRHGGLMVDPAARQARMGEQPVDLTRSELAIVEALLRAHGAVLSRAQLLEAIYGDHAYRDLRGIDVHVHHVRDKLAAAGGDPDMVVTVRGAGYRIGP